MSLPTQFLPHLTGSSTASLARTPGAWDDSGALRLSALANSLAVHTESAEIHSVPDPWARVILFDRALYNEDHVLHRQVLGEWRGTLALLGLRERLGLNNLVATPVNLQAGAAQQTPFAEVLRRVLPSPRDLLRASDTWLEFYLLGWNAGRQPRPFGMTSPATLVATGADYSGVLPAREIPWLRPDALTGRTLLTDPADVLSGAERLALAEWVLALHARLPQMDAPRGGWMLSLLREFAASLGMGHDVSAPPAEQVLSGDRGLGMTRGLAALLDRPHQRESRTLSHLLLGTDRPDAPRYVLIAPEAAAQLGREPREVVVHRDITLASVDSRVPDWTREREGRLSAPGEAELRWCRADFFFSTHLLYEPNTQLGASSGGVAEPFPGCRPVRVEGQPDLRRILLPLNEPALHLFSPDYLERHFSVEWRSDGSAVCRLRVEVRSLSNDRAQGQAAGGEARGTDPHVLVLTREYGRDECVRIPNLLPVGIWPNFRIPMAPARWTAYFLYESWYGVSKTDDFAVSPPTRLRVPGAESGLLGSPGAQFQVTRMTEFPEYLQCTMSPRETRDGFLGRPAGLLLLRPAPVELMPGTRRAALGIDFGTTGTSMYWAWENPPQPEQMRFKDRFVPVTDYDRSERERLTRRTFVPARDWETGKILSVYQAFQEPIARELQDGHVLFASDRDEGDYIAGDRGLVYSDLKWGDERETNAAKGFLGQLCLQGLAELVAREAGRVDIRYSYPTAFSVSEKARFTKVWANVLRRVGESTDAEIEDNGDQAENREAVAATRFFSDPRNTRGFAASRGGLTVDIGGGTTDLALWNPGESGEPTLRSHLSVLFAGRDMFLAPIRRRPTILSDIDPALKGEVAKIEYERSRSEHPEAFNAQIDALIAAHGNHLLELLPERAGRVEGFLDILSAGLCGLGFYAGLLAGRQAAGNGYAPDDLLPVFVGGNGSRLLRWCALDAWQPGMPIYDNFAGCVLAGLQEGNPALRPKVRVHLSEQPKQEVAFGLVARGLGTSSQMLVIDKDFILPLAGESSLVAGGERRDWKDGPSAAELRSRAVRVDRGLPVFHTFLQAADLEIDPDLASAIADRLDDRLLEIGNKAQELRGRNADAETLDPLRKEPLFIMALKLYVADLVDRWVTRG